MAEFSYIDHLECTICGNEFPYDGLATVSDCCGKVLFVRYDLPRLRREVGREVFDGRPANMWRYNELLPVSDPGSVITLGEGGTPLLDATTLAREVGIRRLLVKEEGLNPTGTFKARGIAAAVSKAVEAGATGFTMPSAGNAAGAAAAYGARAGTPVKVFMPQGRAGCQQEGIHRRRFRAEPGGRTDQRRGPHFGGHRRRAGAFRPVHAERTLPGRR